MSIATLQGLTVPQLAEITDKVTSSDKSYWESHAYAQIHKLVAAISSNFVNVKDYGATGDGATDDYAAVANADAAAAAGAGILWFPAGTYKIGTTHTFDSGSLLCFAAGASLSVDSGKSVSIAKMGFAPSNEQIFAGDGSVSIGVGGARIVYAEWWGGAATAVLKISNCIVLDNGIPIPPRITTSVRDALTEPQNGSIIYNLTTNTLQVRENDIWKNITTSL